MIAGTLAVLEEPAAAPLSDYHDSGQRALDVDESHTYLDEYRIQQGRVAGRVKQEAERVHINGSDIAVERTPTRATVATPFIADVDRDGWILAERTHTTGEDHLPPWPFSQFQVITGATITPMGLDVPAFVERQQDAGREVTVEMTTTEREHSGDTRIQWESQSVDAATRANVGTALTVHWGGRFVRLVAYASGYVAIWEPELPPATVGRFVHEEVVPVAVPLDEDEETEQQEVTA